MTDMLDPSDWLSVEEVAQILGKSRATLDNQRTLGASHPPFYRFDRRIRYRKSEVEEWLRRRRVIAPADQLSEQADS